MKAIYPERFKDTWIYKKEQAERNRILTDNSMNLKHKKIVDDGKLTKTEVNEMINRENRKSNLRKRIEYALLMWKPFQFEYTYEPLKTFKDITPPWSLLSNINRIITIGILIPFFIVGIVNIIAKKDLFGIGLLIILMIHTLIHAYTYMQPRYVLPVLPCMTLIAARGIWICITVFNEKAPFISKFIKKIEIKT